LERQTSYVIHFVRSTAFLKLFLKNNFLSKLTRLTARFISNKAGHHTHLSLLRNPFLKLFFEEQIPARFSPACAACIVSNKAGHSTHKKKQRNFFYKKFYSTHRNRQKSQ